MASCLIDTDILVDHLRAKRPATEFLKNLYRRGEFLFCSVISEAEIYSFLLEKEIPVAEALFGSFRVIGVDSSLARQAGAYRRKFFKSHHLNIPDALIAATAQIYQLILVTRNKKHYPMTDIKIEIPY